jgi:hypothetical protein
MENGNAFKFAGMEKFTDQKKPFHPHPVPNGFLSEVFSI